MTVLIAGGGIGGLSLALSLHQVGINCIVFESIERIRPLGVGINILPHAARELIELDLEQQISQIAIETAELAYFSKHGKQIWAEPRGRSAGYNWPQFSLHRGKLQMLLLDVTKERLGADAVRLGHHLTGWEDGATGVRLNLVDRTTGRQLDTVEGSILVAADGIHSEARKILYPDEGPPRWNGAILWRGVSNAQPFLTGSSMAQIGHQWQKFVTYPISNTTSEPGTALINWIAELKFDTSHAWRREDWNRPGRLEDFLPKFESWRFDWLDVPALIRSAQQIYEYPMVDRDPLPSWSAGRMTLLGDAAHPMYPIGSNGASQAILDARVLTRAFQIDGLTSDALEAYELVRRPATANIVTANRATGPDEVLDLVEARAPNGFDDVEDIISYAERAAIADKYKALAGFDKDSLNARQSIVIP